MAISVHDQTLAWATIRSFDDVRASAMSNLANERYFSFERDQGLVVEVPKGHGFVKFRRLTAKQLQKYVSPKIRFTKSGNVSKNQRPPPEAKSYSWWLSQLLHYGLPFAFSADEASTIIRMAMMKGLLNVPKHLANLEAREKKKFEVEDDTGVTVQMIDGEIRETSSEEDDAVQNVENLVVDQDLVRTGLQSQEVSVVAANSHLKSAVVIPLRPADEPHIKQEFDSLDEALYHIPEYQEKRAYSMSRKSSKISPRKAKTMAAMKILAQQHNTYASDEESVCTTSSVLLSVEPPSVAASPDVATVSREKRGARDPRRKATPEEIDTTTKPKKKLFPPGFKFCFENLFPIKTKNHLAAPNATTFSDNLHQNHLNKETVSYNQECGSQSSASSDSNNLSTEMGKRVIRAARRRMREAYLLRQPPATEHEKATYFIESGNLTRDGQAAGKRRHDQTDQSNLAVSEIPESPMTNIPPRRISGGNKIKSECEPSPKRVRLSYVNRIALGPRRGTLNNIVRPESSSKGGVSKLYPDWTAEFSSHRVITSQNK